MIKKIIDTLNQYLQQEKLLHLLVIGAGIILSFARIQDSVINRDAIVYLSTAETFLEQGFSGNFKTYSWLPFSILGATLSKITSISLESCFYIINTLLYAITPIIFMRLYVAITNNRSALPLVALLVLLLPSFNGYRDMIIRDIGFWCFSLLALLSFLRFNQKQHFSQAVIWQITIGIAFLFRTEALAWIIGLPLCLFWVSTAPLKEKVKQLFVSTSLYSVTLLSSALALLINQTTLTSLQDKSSAASAFFTGLDRFKVAQEQMTLHALNEYSAESASLIFTSGLLTYFVITVLLACGIIYFGIATTAMLKHHRINWSAENQIVLWALALNLFALLIFLFAYQFVIERYAVLAALLILLLISQPIIQWTKTIWPQMRSWLKCGFVFLALIALVDIVVSKNPPPTNLKSAGEWLQKNTNLDTPIALNDNRLLHYSGRLKKGITCVIDRDLRVSLNSFEQLKHYSYIVIQTKKESLPTDTAPLMQNSAFEKIEEFSRGKSVIAIFKNNSPNPDRAIDCNPFR